MGWNTSYAQAYINGSLCESVAISDYPSNEMGMGGEGQDSGDSLLIGAWRGAPDGTGTDQRGGYYTGVVDNIEVSF